MCCPHLVRMQLLHSLHTHQAMRGGVSGPAPAPNTSPPGPSKPSSSSLINVTAFLIKYGRADYATLMPVYGNLKSVDPNTSKINSLSLYDTKADGKTITNRDAKVNITYFTEAKLMNKLATKLS